MPIPTSELLKQCGTEVYAAWQQAGCDVRDEQMAVYSECQNSGKPTVDCRSEQMGESGERGERCMRMCWHALGVLQMPNKMV